MNEARALPAAAAPAAPLMRVPWHWRVAEQVSGWLPVLLMALLALGTWWLVKNTPGPPADRGAVAVRHEPDYTMRDFSVQRFTPQGALRVRIEGDRLRHYPDTSTVEIDDARIHALAPDGGVIDATARRAIADDQATELQLHGGAQVLAELPGGEPPIELQSEFLHLFLDSRQVRSHLPVIARRGATELRADSFAYDHRARVLQLKGHVRAVFPPACAQGLAAASRGAR